MGTPCAQCWKNTTNTRWKFAHLQKKGSPRANTRFSAFFITRFQRAVYKPSRPIRPSQIASHHTFRHYSHAVWAPFARRLGPIHDTSKAQTPRHRIAIGLGQWHKRGAKRQKTSLPPIIITVEQPAIRGPILWLYLDKKTPSYYLFYNKVTKGSSLDQLSLALILLGVIWLDEKLNVSYHTNFNGQLPYDHARIFRKEQLSPSHWHAINNSIYKRHKTF